MTYFFIGRLIYFLDPSVLTGLSCTVMILCLADYLVPTLAPRVFGSNKWWVKGRQQVLLSTTGSKRTISSSTSEVNQIACFSSEHFRSSGKIHRYLHSMYVLALSPLATSLALVQELGSLVSLSDRLQLLLSVQCQAQCWFDSADLHSAVRGLAMHITFCRASQDQTPGIYFSIWQLPVALSFKLSIWSCFMPRNKMQWLSRNGNRFPLRLWVNIYDVFVLPIKTLFVCCVCFLSTILFLRRTTEQQQRFHEICGNLVKTQRRVLGWWKRLFALKEEKPKMVCSFDSTFLVLCLWIH